MDRNQQRAIELKRRAWTDSKEAVCLGLKKGDSVIFRMPDIQSYQRIKTRLSRQEYGTFNIELTGNNLQVTRNE